MHIALNWVTKPSSKLLAVLDGTSELKSPAGDNTVYANVIKIKPFKRKPQSENQFLKKKKAIAKTKNKSKVTKAKPYRQNTSVCTIEAFQVVASSSLLQKNAGSLKAFFVLRSYFSCRAQHGIVR